jgi:C4-dicarboxylate-specific signal transduction histidine kinase
MSDQRKPGETVEQYARRPRPILSTGAARRPWWVDIPRSRVCSMNTVQRLKVLIATVLEQHRHEEAAIDELARTLDDEVEARVRDRIADLRQQLERQRR